MNHGIRFSVISVFIIISVLCSSCLTVQSDTTRTARALDDSSNNPAAGIRVPDTRQDLRVIAPDGGLLPDGSWNIAMLDTARNLEYLTDIEKDVILEMNKVRSNPALYAKMYLETMYPRYQGMRFVQDGNVVIQTHEGISAAREAVDVLKRASAVPILYSDYGLYLAARDHAGDQAASGKTGHQGSDGSSHLVRVQRYGSVGQTGENITYGLENGREIVTWLLIDDGVPGRGHRINLLDPDYVLTGASFGRHPVYLVMCVILYADRFTARQ